MSNLTNAEIIKLIENHEDQNVELKESFRWNFYKKQIDRSISKKITRTICSFLASKDGGIIIIGVKNNKQIIGIKSDINSYDDKDLLNGRDCLLADIGEKIRENIGIKVISNCFIRFRKIDDKQIIIIKVKPYDGPIFHLKKELYVRITNTTKKLTGREAYEYLRTNYNYGKFRYDLEYAFFTIMKYFRIVRNVMLKKKEKYYSLFLITFGFNLFWYISLFFDYIDSQFLFPIAFSSIFYFSINLSIDLFINYRKSQKMNDLKYKPSPSRKLVLVSILTSITFSFLLSFLLYRVISLMIGNLKLLILYLLILIITIIIHILIRRELKRLFIGLKDIEEEYLRNLRSTELEF